MLGNFVTGISILAPAGMLPELSHAFGVSIHEAGLLITFGAVVLCIASPLSAWLTSSFDRRRLLSVAVAVMAAAQVATVLAPDYATLMAVRLVMLAVAALFTPQAAGTAAMMVPPARRGSTMSYVFLGWSLALAVGLPLITYVSSHLDWRIAHGGIGVLALVNLAMLVWRIPPGLKGMPVDLKTWRDLARNPLIVLLLLVTILQTSGQFAVFTYLGPLFIRLGGSSELAAIAFGIYGVMGFIGTVIASRIVDTWGAYRTSLATVALLLLGIGDDGAGNGDRPRDAGVDGRVWGFAFSAANSMQQVRLAEAAPPFAGVTGSLNTSGLYVGRPSARESPARCSRTSSTVRSAIGHGFLVLALITVILSRTRPGLRGRRVVDAAPARVAPRQVPARAGRRRRRHVCDAGGAPRLAAQQPRSVIQPPAHSPKRAKSPRRRKPSRSVRAGNGSRSAATSYADKSRSSRGRRCVAGCAAPGAVRTGCGMLHGFVTWLRGVPGTEPAVAFAHTRALSMILTAPAAKSHGSLVPSRLRFFDAGMTDSCDADVARGGEGTNLQRVGSLSLGSWARICAAAVCLLLPGSAMPGTKAHATSTIQDRKLPMNFTWHAPSAGACREVLPRLDRRRGRSSPPRRRRSSRTSPADAISRAPPWSGLRRRSCSTPSRSAGRWRDLKLRTTVGTVIERAAADGIAPQHRPRCLLRVDVRVPAAVGRARHVPMARGCALHQIWMGDRADDAKGGELFGAD